MSAVAMPQEMPVTTTWPTIGAYSAGRLVGSLTGLRIGWGFLLLAN